jgi:ABC-type phosphate transport system substrate-binding protein
MRSHFARRIKAACVLSGAVAVAFAAPGTASASLGTQCSGEGVTGQGASLLKIAEQSILSPNFNSPSDTNASACSGTQGSLGTPAAKYTSSSSSAGLESWGANGKAGATFGATNAFIGTEEPPNPTQTSEIEAPGAPGTLLTIPILQSAIAIVIHLPTGCTANSTVAPGRLVLEGKTLEKLFQGTVTNWSKIKSSEGGNEILGCTKKALKADPIIRVVREDGAGTTAILKKYLNLIDKKAVDGSKTWQQISEASANLLWPNETSDLVRAKGDSGLATKVAAEPGSIGYVSLADARANGDFTPGTGGPGTGLFWAEIQNRSKPSVTYADPATNLDVAAKQNSNCESTTYTNGSKKFPPPNTTQSWSEVTSSTTETNYTICGFAFALAFNSYSTFPSTTLNEATTVNNFLKFTLNTETGGGQKLLLNNDYLPLPTNAVPSLNVLEIAQEGANNVAF